MRYLYLAALPLLFVACSEQAPMEPIAEAPDAAFDFMNNPDVGNLKVYRFQDDIFSCWTDPENGLRACHANFPLGGGSDPDCGLQSDEAPVGYQQVVLDADGLRVITNATGDVWITVRDTNAPGVCFGDELVAEGRGTLRYTDNDTFGSGTNNANHWGFAAQGALMTPAGDPVQYSGHAQLRWNYAQYFRFASAQVTVR